MQAAAYTKRSAGLVSQAYPLWAEVPPVAHGHTVAQLSGLRYESKAARMLEATFKYVVPQLAFRYTSNQLAWFKCWTDLCLFSDDMSTVTVVEVKWHHTIDAWIQLRELYVPVVRTAFPRLRIQSMEVCQFYDPGVRIPGRMKLAGRVSEVEKFVQGEEHSDFTVLIWTGR